MVFVVGGIFGGIFEGILFRNYNIPSSFLFYFFGDLL